jgi:hypothetical protein
MFGVMGPFHQNYRGLWRDRIRLDGITETLSYRVVATIYPLVR